MHRLSHLGVIFVVLNIASWYNTVPALSIHCLHSCLQHWQYQKNCAAFVGQIHGRREGWSNQEALRDMDLVFEVGHLQVTRINQLFLRSTDVVFPVNGRGKKPPVLPSDHFLSYWFLKIANLPSMKHPKHNTNYINPFILETHPIQPLRSLAMLSLPPWPCLGLLMPIQSPLSQALKHLGPHRALRKNQKIKGSWEHDSKKGP